MRKILIALLPLLLTACVDDSASYYIDGATSNHALTLHRSQLHFWNNEVDVDLIVSRVPDCQRRLPLAQMPADDVEIELYSNGDDVWTLRAGKQLWQFDAATCTQYAEAKGELGELTGVYRVDGDKLVFEAAVAAPAAGDAATAPNATPAAGSAPAAATAADGAPVAAPATAPAAAPASTAAPAQ